MHWSSEVLKLTSPVLSFYIKVYAMLRIILGKAENEIYFPPVFFE